MNPRNKLGEALLSQFPATDNLNQLRSQALDAIEHEQRNVRRKQIAVQAFWIFCAISATIYMWFGPDAARTPRAPFLACFFLLWGGIEVLKHRIDAARVATLVELKHLQLTLAEMRAAQSERK